MRPLHLQKRSKPMDTLNVHPPLETAPGLAYCACCTPHQLLTPRDVVGPPGRWAVCVAPGAWYENRGDGVFGRTAAPRVGEIVPAPLAQPLTGQRPTQWTG